MTRPISDYITVFGIFVFLLSRSCAPTPAHADDIPEEDAIRALIGEAGGQGDEELLAHAYALRNRGTLRGVYGAHATHTPNPTPEQWQRVSGAWWTSLLNDDEDPVDGRTEWRSEFDLKLMASKDRTPKSQRLYDGLKVGETTFYRLRKK